MTGIAVVLTGDDRTRGAFASAGGNLKSFGAGIKSTLGVLRDLTIVGQGAARLFQSMGRAIGGTIEAARQAVNADVKLAGALAHTGQEVAGNLKLLREWADVRQKATGHDDEATKGLLAMGAQLGLTGQDLRDAVSAAQDWSLVMEVDAATAIKALAATASGGEAQLGRLKIQVDENATSAEQFAQAIRQMKGGFSEAVGALPTTGLIHLKNTLGDLREGIGIVITETRTFRAIMTFLSAALDKVKAALSDPSKMRAFAKAIDDAAVQIVRAVRTVVVGLLQLVELMAHTFLKVARAFGQQTSEMSDGIIGLAVTFSGAAESADKFFHGLLEGINAAAPGIGEGLGKIGEMFKDVVPKQVDDKAIREQAEAMGAVYGDVFSQSMIESFDRNVGVQDAFKNMGDNARNAFVGQMSAAAFEPMRQSFGQLAQAMAAPFNIVGKVINDLIVAPVVNFITSLIGQLLAQIGIVSSVTTAASAQGATAGIAAVTAVGAAATAMGIPLTAAAAASAIASMGASLQFGPMAVGAIAAAKAAAPGIFAIPGLAEGGLIMPRAGHPEGRTIRVAENRPEWVLSTEQAQRQFGGGGGRGDTFVVNLRPEQLVLSERENDRQAMRIADAAMGQLRRVRIGGRRRR